METKTATTTEKKVGTDYWKALESDPGVLDELAHALGLKAEWKLTELYGLDEECLKMVSGPVEALIFLYPDDGEIKPDGKDVLKESSHFFIEQIESLGNACGTIALMHAIANKPDLLLDPKALIQDFITKNAKLEPSERGMALSMDSTIQQIHDKFAEINEDPIEPQEGEGELVNVEHHYICFMNVGGKLMEFDGLKEGPVDRGSTTDATFLKNAVELLQKLFISKLGGIQYCLMAINKP